MSRRPVPFRERRSEQGAREPRKRVLIVCEGAKTEPHYFLDARARLRLATASVQIVGGDKAGSSPSTLVEYARSAAENDGDFDEVYCVFDRDEHADYDAATSRCYDLDGRTVGETKICFRAITSDPCFEYWLLLHFVDTDRPFTRSGRKTAADCAVSEVKRHIRDYAKGRAALFTELEHLLAA